MLCLLTLENGYEILGSATKRITNDRDEEEARGITYQRAVYQQIELESLPQTRTVGVIATNLV